jgi:DNA-binding NarL/FixJ family response regulator
MAHSVLIVEDDAPTRARLAAAVASHPELRVAGQAGDFAAGLAALRATRPEVLLVDLGLPDQSGVRLIRAARQICDATQSMVITVFADEKHVMEAIEAGARGYLLKDGSAAYVARSILQLLSGGSPISAPIARYLLRRFQAEGAEGEGKAAAATQAPPSPGLTPREHEVLRLLAKGFTYDEIADVLGISSHTVTTHVRHIYRKLEVGSRGQAVYEAASLGLIDLGD